MMLQNSFARKSMAFFLAGLMLSATAAPLAMAAGTVSSSSSLESSTTNSMSGSGSALPTQTTGAQQNMNMLEQPATSQIQSGTISETTVSSIQGQAHTIPAGTSFRIRANGSMPDSLGERFNGTLVNPVSVSGRTVLPSGSNVTGEVVAVNPTAGTVDIQLREVSALNGNRVPIQARTSVNVVQGSAIQAADAGAVTANSDQGYRFFPRVSWGRRQGMTRGGKIVASTLGGAVLGAGTGALTGVIMPAVYRDDIDFSEGTGAVRGLAWGSAIGAGLGLISGLVFAATDRNTANVTSTTSTSALPRHPITNISTGSLEEIPVSTQTNALGSSMNQEFTVVLEQPATVRM